MAALQCTLIVAGERTPWKKPGLTAKKTELPEYFPGATGALKDAQGPIFPDASGTYHLTANTDYEVVMKNDAATSMSKEQLRTLIFNAVGVPFDDVMFAKLLQRIPPQYLHEDFKGVIKEHYTVLASQPRSSLLATLVASGFVIDGPINAQAPHVFRAVINGKPQIVKTQVPGKASITDEHDAYKALAGTPHLLPVQLSTIGNTQVLLMPACFFSLQHVKRPLVPEYLSLLKAQVLESLRHIHQKGFAFCDLKPDNLLMGFDGTLYLADYGGVTPVGQPARETTYDFIPNASAWHDGTMINGRNHPNASQALDHTMLDSTLRFLGQKPV